MSNTINKLIDLVGMNPGFIGLGVAGRGDDAAGLILARLLKRRQMDSFVIHNWLENFIIPIELYGKKDIILIDAVEFGAEPGSFMLAESADVVVRCNIFSTHGLSLKVFSDMIRLSTNANTHMLGIQPKYIKDSWHVSDTVRKTLVQIYDIICKYNKSVVCKT